MADFLLSVGVDVGLSFDQMQKDISGLVSQLNGNPPKIKVGLEIDKAAISDFKNQISNLSKSSNGANNVKVGVDNINTGAKSAAADMATMAKNARDAAAALKTTDSAFKNTATESKILTTGTTEYYTALKQVNTLLNQVTNSQEKWTAAKNGKSRAAYSELEVYANELRNLQQQLQSGGITVDDFKNRLASIRTGVTSVSGTIKSAGEATRTWGERIGSLSAKFGTWLSITQVIMAGIRTVKAMASNVVELDTAMTELRKVTDETEASYDRFLERATSRSKELGAALSDTVTATADFARLGYGLSEAEKLADAAIVYKNVGDGIEDISTASESIISTMQAFGIPAEQAMTIVDKFNEVGNKYAISSKGVGDALLRSAAAMKAAGNTIDQTIALATAANTVVQDPDKVGTALKTVSMRLRGAETELEEAGLETDGMAKSVSKLREELLALTGGKLDIQLDDDTFKSTYDMLKELSAVWDELTDVSRANILELIAGKNQSNVVAALLENFSVAENSLKTSMDSAGSALQENEKVLESIEGRMQILKATFQEFSSTMISDNFLKGLISTGTTVLEIINNIVTSLGGLGSTIGIIGSFIVALNLTSVVSKLKSLFETIQIFAMLKWDSIFNSGFVKGLQAIPAGLKALTTGSQAAASAFQMLGGASSVATVGLTALVAVIGIATIAYQKHKQAQEEARKKTLEEANAVVENTNTLRDAYVTYMQYANRNNLTTSEESAFASAIDQVTQSLGAKASALEGVTAGTQGYTEAVKQAAKADLEQAVTEAKKAKKAAQDNLKESTYSSWGGSKITIDLSGRTGIPEFVSAYEEVERIMKDFMDEGTWGKELEPIGWDKNQGKGGYDSVVDYYYKLIELQDNLANAGNMENDIYKKANEITGKLKDNVEDYVKKKYEELSLTYQLNNGIPTTIEEFKKYRDYLNTELGEDFIFDDGNNQLSNIIDGYLSATKTYAEYINKLGDTSSQVSAIDSKISEIKENFTKSSEAIKQEATDLGVDLSQTVFGNIDTNNRQVLEWTDENIAKYKSALESWEASAEEMKGSISTVFGSSDEFDGVEIAFSPMLQTENGAVLLDKDTVYRYINSLIESAGEGWTTEDLLHLDASGLEMDGQLIKGLIADIGETAIKTGEAMHFVGENGAIKEAEKEAQAFSKWIDELSDKDKEIVYDISLTTDTAEWTLEEWQDNLNNLKADTQALDIIKSKVQAIKDVARGTISFDIDSENSGIDSLNSAIGESISAVGLTADAISKIQSRYSSLSDFDAATLFEKTVNGIHLNADALRELDSEYEAVQKAYLDTALDEQVERYNNLSEKISECTDVQERAKLIAEQNTLGSQIEQTSILAAQYEGLTSAYQKWMDAQSGGEEGDMYDNVAENLEGIKELYDKGLVGTNEFRAAAQMMTNYDISDWGIEDIMKAYENGYPLMKRYFTDGQEGCQRFLSDVSKLNSEWAHMNKDGSWEIDFGSGNDQEIADKLGISVDAVQSILRKLSDYGFEINLDSVLSDLGLLEDKFSSANEKLKELGYTEVDFNINSDKIKDIDNQIKQATDVLNKFKNSDGTVNLSLDGVEEATMILAALIQKKQELNTPAVMSVDTTHAESDVENVIVALQDFQTKYNKLEIDTAIGVDTTESQAGVDSAIAALNESSPEILASLGIDTTSAETIKAGIEALTPEVIVKAGVDASLVEGYQAAEHNAEGTVKWDNDTLLVDNWIAQTHNAEGTIKWGNNTDNVKTHFTATGTVNWNGTSDAWGTAFKNGSWGTKKSGVALGGELGQELVVRDGRFFTVGDDGAEFFRYKKNDIIFNADQTKQIFEQGKITAGNRRGRALAEGTAFSGGTGKFYQSGKVQKTVSTYKANDTIKASAEVEVKDVDIDTKSVEESMEDKLKEMQETIDDTINDYEHQIFLLEKHNASDSEIIAIYSEMQKRVHDQAEAYRAKGLDENSEYIQKMQKQWWDYQDKIGDIIAQGYEDNRKELENAADLANIQLEKAVESRDYTAVSDYTTSIIGYYRQMQESVHDQAEYYRSLGYDDTSDEVSELSKLWWEYEENITEAVESGYDALVEKARETIDTIQNVYDTLKSAAEEFGKTGKLPVDLLTSMSEIGIEYMSYLKDENGMLSINKDRIDDVIAARTKQLAVDTAMSYIEKLKLALTKGNISEINKLIYATENASNATWELVYSNLALLDLDDSQYKQVLSNINRFRSLADNAISGIYSDSSEERSAVLEDTKDALDTILDLTMDLVEYEVNQEIDALEEQKEKYRDIIELKKEALQTTKEENDYNKEVAKKVAEIAKLQSQINKLALDDSREAQAEKAALEEELSELQTDLADYQADYSIEKQTDMLDKMADAYDEEKDEEIEALEESISSTEKIYQLAIKRIRKDWDGLYEDILDWNYEAGSSVESDIVSAWELATKAVQKYGSYVKAVKGITSEETDEDLNLGESGSYGDPKEIISQMRSNSLAWLTASDSEQSSLANKNSVLASQLAAIYDKDIERTADGLWYLEGSSDPLYSIDKWEAVDYITKAMRNNSAKWSSASASEKAALEKANEKMAGYIADLSGQNVWKDADGVWWIGNDNLYDSYGRYHTGGVVGDSTLKQDEVMAILKNGELVLDEQREKSLYKLVDFAQLLSERLGTVIDTTGFRNMFDSFSLLPTSRELLPVTNGGSSIEFSPKIEVNISHSGAMDDSDARRYGNIAAETALSNLKEAFTKKGISNIGSASLK